MEVRKISFNIYANNDEEAERGCKAIKQFIDIIGQHGAMVTGDKIADAVSKLPENTFVLSQIIKFFKK